MRTAGASTVVIASGRDVAARINARYRDGWSAGGQSSDGIEAGLRLRDAGVLLHQFDTIDRVEPTDASGPTWLLSVEKREWSDRISAVLVNHRLRDLHTTLPIYSNVQSGIVLNPDVAKVLCSYSKDGGTQHHTCDPPGVSTGPSACVPGCAESGQTLWGEDHLEKMLAEQAQARARGATNRYNEVVVDAATFARHLPQAVEAVFFVGVMSDAHCSSTNTWANTRGSGINHCERYARAAHAAFLRRFGLASNDVPLLRLDVDTSSTEPFTLADAHAPDPIATSSKTGERVTALCLSNFHASNVEADRDGRQPQLWVYEGQGGTAQKTAAAEGGRQPKWPGSELCVSLAPRADRRTCFDIRDASRGRALKKKEDGPPLLHFGCALLTADNVDGAAELTVNLDQYSVGDPLRPAASISFAVALPPPPSPPSPPAPPSRPPWRPAICGASPWCSEYASWLAAKSPESKFLAMWGTRGWHFREPREPGCWRELGGPSFFADVLSGAVCDRNWMEGAIGGSSARPSFSRPAPALLGFDSTIWEYCSLQTNQDLFRFSHPELASRCVKSNNNILRIVGGTWGWNMCQNFAWQMCAATGRLPGQDGARLRFATSPRTLTLREWQHPTSWPCEGAKPCPPGQYAVGDVFYAEIAVFRALCRNANQLFEVDRGQLMTCNLDAKAFGEFTQTLMAS